MHDFFERFQRGIRWSLHYQPLLTLYLVGVLIGFINAAWPSAIALSSGVTQPWIGELAAGSSDALVALIIGGGENAALVSVLWVAAALLMATIYAVAYNFISGGALSLWYGVRSFGAGCRFTFWSFTGLGALLLLLLLPALAVAVLLGVWLGAGVGAFTALLLIQLLNLAGEYARALIVRDQQRNPAAALRRAFAFCARNPSTILLGVLGFLLHAALGWLATRSAALPSVVALMLGQCWALGWVWLKLLRLAWAAALLQPESSSASEIPTALPTAASGTLEPGMMPDA